MEWSQQYDTLANAIAGDESTVDEAKALIPDIIRLVEDPDIKKNIEFDEISIAAGDDQSNDPTVKSVKIDIGGVAFPIIRINDYVFQTQSIRYMRLSCDSFLPTITVKIKTIESNVVNKNMAKDGDMISLYMRAPTSALEYVRCDFIITSVTTGAVSSMPNVIGSTINVSGVLFIPKFNATRQNTLGYIGTSRDVLRHIAEDFGIGFAYNDEDNTNDFQGWISVNRTIPEYITELTQHSWKDNVSFYRTWIDVYYNLVYVNVNKYLNSPENNSEIDITFMTNVISNMDKAMHDPSPDNAKAMLKVFCNLPQFRGTPFYIKKWAPSNNSTSISFGIGYSVSLRSFIHNQGIMNSNIDDSFSELECIPSYNKEKAKEEIILRGRSYYDPDQNPETDRETINYDFVNTYIKKQWYGVLQMLNDDEKDMDSNNNWSGNVHKNYALAPTHNNINMAELNKLYITIECEGLNLQVQRGEYVPVLIGFTSDADYLMNNSVNDIVQEADLKANRMFSGYYYVDSVQYIYKYGTGSFSDFSTIFTLKRREWPTPEKIAVENNNEEKLPEEEVDNEQMG